MLSLFRRAQQGLSLTPGERAALKLIKGWALTGAVAGIAAGGQALLAPSVNWRVVIYATAGAFVATTYAAIAKYYTAHQDAPLANVLSGVAAAIVAQMPTSNHTPPSATATPAPSSASVGATAVPPGGVVDGYVPAPATDAPAAS